MTTLPAQTNYILETINNHFAKQRSLSPYFPRRIGGSLIGEDCSRAVWYTYRHCSAEEPNGQLAQICDIGDFIETQTIEALKSRYQVWDRDEKDPDEQITFTANDGTVVVKLDGVLLGYEEAPKTPHVLEIKQAHVKKYTKMKSQGIKKATPGYFAQVQLCMHLAELKRALVVSTNRNYCWKSEHVFGERLHLDKPLAIDLLEKAKWITTLEEPPDGVSTNPSWWQCKTLPCRHFDICHGGAEPLRRCRTCCFSKLGKDGYWDCWLMAQTRCIQERKAGNRVELNDFISEVERVPTRELPNGRTDHGIGCKHWVSLPCFDGGKMAEMWRAA